MGTLNCEFRDLGQNRNVVHANTKHSKKEISIFD